MGFNRPDRVQFVIRCSDSVANPDMQPLESRASWPRLTLLYGGSAGVIERRRVFEYEH
jgi:hypothetical protein